MLLLLLVLTLLGFGTSCAFPTDTRAQFRGQVIRRYLRRGTTRHCNSIMESSNSCACLDGYTGAFSGSGSMSIDTYIAEQYHSAISNIESGYFCFCLDGYVGAISWSGDTPIRTSMEARCGKANPHMESCKSCACFDGYPGAISWSGSTPFQIREEIQCDTAKSNPISVSHDVQVWLQDVPTIMQCSASITGILSGAGSFTIVDLLALTTLTQQSMLLLL